MPLFLVEAAKLVYIGDFPSEASSNQRVHFSVCVCVRACVRAAAHIYTMHGSKRDDGAMVVLSGGGVVGVRTNWRHTIYYQTQLRRVSSETFLSTLFLPPARRRAAFDTVVCMCESDPVPRQFIAILFLAPGNTVPGFALIGGPGPPLVYAAVGGSYRCSCDGCGCNRRPRCCCGRCCRGCCGCGCCGCGWNGNIVDPTDEVAALLRCDHNIFIFVARILGTREGHNGARNCRIEPGHVGYTVGVGASRVSEKSAARGSHTCFFAATPSTREAAVQPSIQRAGVCLTAVAPDPGVKIVVRVTRERSIVFCLGRENH